MRIAEIFHSLQGEGRLAGTPTTFVRTTGCNLRCWFCDTAYTSWEPEGEHMSLDAVLEHVRRFDCRNVDVTGGEPFLQREIVPLTQRLRGEGCFVTLETAGTVDRPVEADLISLSPKLANSTPRDSRWSARHEQRRDRPDVIRRLLSEYDYQLKFVVDRPEDLDDVAAWLARFPEARPEHVWLMPQATTADDLARQSAWLQPAAARAGYQFSPRLHVELFNNARGT